MSWKQLRENIRKAAEDLVVLNIKTTVVQPSSQGGSEVVVMSIQTDIEQVTGDVATKFTESVFTAEYGQFVREYHEQQRAVGLEILKRNVDVIRQLLEMVTAHGSDEPEPPKPPLPLPPA